MWGFAQDNTIACDLSIDDSKFQDLRQENMILKKELSDLYSNLMIIDDSTEIKESSKASSVGRLIIYDKAKHDIEILLSNEASRQKIVSLEKELAFQLSHQKEQARVMKDQESSLSELKYKFIQLELELLDSNVYKTKVTELTNEVQNQLKLSFGLSKQLDDITQLYTKASQQVLLLQQDLEKTNSCLSNAKNKLFQAEQQLTDYTSECTSLKEQCRHISDALTESQIHAKKADVLLLVEQAEVRHLNRKCDSQGKEIVRLKAIIDRRQQEDEEHAAQQEDKQQHVMSDDETEANTPLMSVDRSARRKSALAVIAGSSSSAAKCNTSKKRHTGQIKASLHRRSLEEDVRQAHHGSQRGTSDIINSRSSGGGVNGVTSSSYQHLSSDTDKEEMYYNEANEDCLCGFFPQPFKL